MFNKVNEQQFQAGDHVIVVSGPMEGTAGRIRRKKGGPVGEREDRWIVDYDGFRADDREGCGYHSPHELRYIQ